MARQARIVLNNTLHHITQRGNRGEHVFLKKEDYKTYLDILQEQCQRFHVSLYSYCLLPNQVHLIVEPKESELLSRAIGETHRRYTNYINERENWRGHLFQDRFFSYATDEQYGLRAARFVETLPVTIGIAPKPENYLWSSAKSRIKVVQNKLLKTFHSFHATQNWEDFLSRPIDPKEMNLIQLHLQTGRPRGSELFLDSIEKQIGRTVRPQKRGRKPYKKAINKKIA
ncbi:MAG TPA: transposase [Alphaproteobacteria bacterium]|nr:transposase [Alphaproteobacteria bacterium]